MRQVLKVVLNPPNIKQTIYLFIVAKRFFFPYLNRQDVHSPHVKMLTVTYTDLTVQCEHCQRTQSQTLKHSFLQFYCIEYSDPIQEVCGGKLVPLFRLIKCRRELP